MWWARQDSNLQPDRYERRTLSGNSSKISVSRSRPFAFVHVCSRGFCRIIGGVTAAAATLGHWLHQSDRNGDKSSLTLSIFSGEHHLFFIEMSVFLKKTAPSTRG